jgi:hypothetical protein
MKLYLYSPLCLHGIVKVNLSLCLTLYRLGPTEQVLPEDADRIQSPKRCVFKQKDSVLDKSRTMNNVRKHNIFIRVFDRSCFIVKIM